MKVCELIEKLKGSPQDARVVVPGYEDGMDDVVGLDEVFIKPDAHKSQWFYGVHDHVPHEGQGTERAVRLLTSRRYGEDD